MTQYPNVFIFMLESVHGNIWFFHTKWSSKFYILFSIILKFNKFKPFLFLILLNIESNNPLWYKSTSEIKYTFQTVFKTSYAWNHFEVMHSFDASESKKERERTHGKWKKINGLKDCLREKQQKRVRFENYRKILIL